MSQSGKLETVAPSLRNAQVSATGPASAASNNALSKDSRGDNSHGANSYSAIHEDLQITSGRAAPIEAPGSIQISMDKTAATGATFFSIQNLLTILPSWTVSIVSHGVVLALLAVIATTPIYDGSALRLDGLMVDATEYAEMEDIESETDVTESDLLKVDVAALNSEASELTSEIVREEGFEVSLLEGMADGIGMEAMANSGLTPIPTADDGGVQGKTEGNTTQFFGTKASGSRFIFIIDGSGSMTQGFRWYQAVRELEKSIGKLNEKQQALVLVYNFHTYPMFDTPPKDLKLLPVTDEFKEALSQWLGRVTPTGGTRPAHALEYSISLEPDAIFLLSDGLIADKSVQMLTRKNKIRDPENGGFRKVPIHAVSLGPDEDGAVEMKKIADGNEGQFNWVR